MRTPEEIKKQVNALVIALRGLDCDMKHVRKYVRFYVTRNEAKKYIDHLNNRITALGTIDRLGPKPLMIFGLRLTCEDIETGP